MTSPSNVSAVHDRSNSVASPRTTQLPWSAFVLVGIAGLATAAYYISQVFLFSDDYLFLGQAREQPTLTVDYLGAGLFNHFSPFSRLFNFLLVDHLPGRPYLVLVVMLFLVGIVIFAGILLVLALFGRTWLALTGALLLSFSLCLLPLGNWWTAGVNILPAIAGSAFALAGMVMLVRGRSGWWGVLCVGGYVMAVLDYESAMLTAGYVALWALLFRRRVTADPWRVVLRRTWWVWSALVAVGAASLLNYWFNYYASAPSAPLSDAGKGLAVSLFNTVIPTVIGWYEGPVNRTWFSTVGTVIGVVALVIAVVWTIRRAPAAWRGWAFAGVGWLLPSAALVLNRPWDFAYNAIYIPLPMTMVVVGVLEAFAAALLARPHPAAPGIADQHASGEDPSPSGRHRRRLGLAIGLVAVFVFGHTVSAPTAATGQLSFFTDPTMREFIPNALSSAAAVGAAHPDFSVIDSRVSDHKVFSGFFPYNTVSRIFGVSGPTVPFDRWTGPYYQVDGAGLLQPVSADWLTRLAVPPGPQEGAVTVTGTDEPVPGAGGSCFTPAEDTSVTVTLPAPVSGTALVIRVTGTVETATTFDWITQATVDSGGVPSDSETVWQPGEDGMLRPIWEPSVQVIHLRPRSAKGIVCLSEIAVGTVVAAPPG